MVTRTYKVEELAGTELKLGRVGEGGVKCIQFDVETWLEHDPSGFIMVYVVPPGSSDNCGHHHGSSGYIAKTSFADGMVSWMITTNDTKTAGEGAIELIMYGKNGEILQSTTVQTKVTPSLSHSNSNGCGCHTNLNQPWIDQVAHIAMEAQDAAERAEAAAEEAKQLVSDLPDEDLGDYTIIHGGDANGTS